MKRVMKKFIIGASIFGTISIGTVAGAIVVYATKFKPEDFRDLTNNLKNVHVGFDGYSINSYLKMDEEVRKEITVEQNGISYRYALSNEFVNGVEITGFPLNLSIGLDRLHSGNIKVKVVRIKLDGNIEKLAFEARPQMSETVAVIEGTNIDKILPSFQFVKIINTSDVKPPLPENDFSMVQKDFSIMNEVVNYGKNAQGSRELSIHDSKNYQLEPFGWYSDSDNQLKYDSFGKPITMIPEGSFSKTESDAMTKDLSAYLNSSYKGAGAKKLIPNNQLEINLPINKTSLNHDINDWNRNHPDSKVFLKNSILKFSSYYDAEVFKQRYNRIDYVGFVTLNNQVQSIPLFQEKYSDGWNMTGIKLQSSIDGKDWKEFIYGQELTNIRKPILHRDSNLTDLEKMTINAWW